MSKMEAKMLGFVGGLILVLVVFVIVRSRAAGAEFSIGWHTTVYPPEVTWSILALITLALSMLLYLVFRTKTKS